MEFYHFHSSFQRSSHQIAYVNQLFDYLVNQQQLCKTEAVMQIAEEMGISDTQMIQHWLNND